MPKADAIVNLPGLTVLRTEIGNPTIVEVKPTYRRICCPSCQSINLRKKARITRRVQHESIGRRTCLLIIHAHKFCCKDCGRYFNQRINGVTPGFKGSQKLKEQLFDLHVKGVSHSDIAKDQKLSHSTLTRWFNECYELEGSKYANRHCPTIMGIDEHRFGKHCRYSTSICDLKKRRIFDVLPGKSKADIHEYLMSLKGRERVRIVCIDLSSSYRSIIKEYFPNAKIVSDRFHVVRLLGNAFLKVYQSLDPSIKNQRGILNILRKLPKNLTEKQLIKRGEFFESQPVIESLYRFKQQLHQLLLKKQQNKIQCADLIDQFFESIEQLKANPFESLLTLAKTLLDWQDEIGRMWRFSRSNGITEGFHRKMKLIQRRAYGFRNFENYRMRVRVLCA